MLQSKHMKIVVQRKYEKEVSDDQVIEDLLCDRNIDGIDEFLQPPHPLNTPFESLFDNKKEFQQSWKKTLETLKDIHENAKNIVVYSDYDADGVTGGAIMWEALHKLGFKVMPYIPDRKEGYGFSKEGIDRVIAEHDPALIISVDHGIVAHKEIEYARTQGVPVIVTDHHSKQGGDPESALAVFHTSKLAGSGVSYFFAKELIQEMGHIQNAAHLQHMARSDYLALAAIGTIADLVPLVGPSRAVARYGLAALGTTSRLGLRNIMRDSRIMAPVTAYHVGFMIAPRINAFGRLEHAIDALRLLCTTSFDRATELSTRAQSINAKRQKRVRQAVAEAEKVVDPSKKIIILDSETWEEGIIGLIAGKMLQKHYRPSIVMTRSGGEAKASVRSVDGVHITDFLGGLKEHLIDMGGHAAAAGFSIDESAIDAFRKAAYEKAEEDITDDLLVRTEYVDIELPHTMVQLPLVERLAQLGPFGMGFKEPIFKSKVPISNIRTMGKSNQHMKIEAGDGIRKLELVAFNADEKLQRLKYGDVIDAVYSVSINEWNGRRTPQGILKNAALV